LIIEEDIMEGTRVKETAKTGTQKNEDLAAGFQFNDNYFVREIEDDDSFKMPLILWLLLAPVLGLFYGILLPVVWIVQNLITLIKAALEALISKMGDVTFFSWNPVKVYFLGRKEGRKKGFSVRDEE